MLMFGSTLSIHDLQSWRRARGAPSECLAGMIALVPDGRLQQRHRNVNFISSHRCFLVGDLGQGRDRCFNTIAPRFVVKHGEACMLKADGLHHTGDRLTMSIDSWIL